MQSPDYRVDNLVPNEDTTLIVSESCQYFNDLAPLKFISCLCRFYSRSWDSSGSCVQGRSLAFFSVLCHLPLFIFGLKGNIFKRYLLFLNGSNLPVFKILCLFTSPFPPLCLSSNPKSPS